MLILLLAGAIAVLAEGSESGLELVPSAPSAPTISYGYRVVRSLPHDPDAFTQGLIIHDGRLLESTGGYGESSLREVDLSSGRVVAQRRLSSQRFGEGLAAVGDRLFQLTWRSGIGIIYDAASFRPLAEFEYAGEGWGLTYDGDQLIMSDGSAFLSFLDPDSLRETHRLEVTDQGESVTRLNELEFVDGSVYANVWGADRIAIIDPGSGRVRAWLDLQGILPVVFRLPSTDVLNGIAYDRATGQLFVTGKRWPRLFEIELVRH